MTVPQGTGLPKAASPEKWMLLANRKLVPKIVSAEIGRAGYCVTKPKAGR
ncbi:MAG: hypothetical protein ACOZAM_14440 [Pseudomonadota bacterium]